jgi:hypothetical protein
MLVSQRDSFCHTAVQRCHVDMRRDTKGYALAITSPACTRSAGPSCVRPYSSLSSDAA